MEKSYAVYMNNWWVNNLKLLVVIEGKDCKNCEKGIIRRYQSFAYGKSCLLCQGKGKSPTKLIFDAEEFRCNCSKGYQSKHIQVINNHDVCKGTGYLLPKKGDYMVICKKNHFFRFYPSEIKIPIRQQICKLCKRSAIIFFFYFYFNKKTLFKGR